MAAPIEQHIEVTVERVEAERAHDSSERSERAAHVDGLARDKHAHRRRERQHDDTSASSRQSDASSNALSTSMAIGPTRITYRPEGVG